MVKMILIIVNLVRERHGRKWVRDHRSEAIFDKEHRGGDLGGIDRWDQEDCEEKNFERNRLLIFNVFLLNYQLFQIKR